jgi:hypothetical protein
MTDHLTQPNQRMTWNLDFTANDGREWTVPYTFELEPVVSAGGRKGWRSKSLNIDDDVLFEYWCNKQKRMGRTPGLYEAISVFKDELYGLCMEHISAGDDTAHWLGILEKLRDDKQLNIEQAKNFDMEKLFANYGLESRYGQYLCPFHNDTNPSMSIHKKTNRFKCWACGESGDTIHFIMKMDKCNFIDAVKKLC